MMKKVLVLFLKVVLFAVLGFTAGLIFGAIIGGNFMTSFEFNGVRGYERQVRLVHLLELYWVLFWGSI